MGIVWGAVVGFPWTLGGPWKIPPQSNEQEAVYWDTLTSFPSPEDFQPFGPKKKFSEVMVMLCFLSFQMCSHRFVEPNFLVMQIDALLMHRVIIFHIYRIFINMFQAVLVSFCFQRGLPLSWPTRCVLPSPLFPEMFQLNRDWTMWKIWCATICLLIPVPQLGACKIKDVGRWRWYIYIYIVSLRMYIYIYTYIHTYIHVWSYTCFVH